MNKLLFIFFIVALSLGFTSCGSDDDDNGIPNGSNNGSDVADTIIGTWESIKITYVFDTDNEVVSKVLSDVFTEDVSLMTSTMTFSNDMTCSSSFDDEFLTGKYRIEGDKIYWEIDDEDDEDIYTYSFENRNLILNITYELNEIVSVSDPFMNTEQYDRVAKRVAAIDDKIDLPNVLIKSISDRGVFKKK